MFDIVVGVDDSVAAARALDRALREAEATGRSLRVVHAWAPPLWLGGTPGFADPDLAGSASTGRLAGELARELLAKGLSRCSSDGPVRATAAAYEGRAGRVLAREAADAGLVVVGGRGDGFLAGALPGRTTAAVLHHAPCPAMVVPATGVAPERFPRVVVGLDGSAGSRSALLWGLDAARREGCPLLAVYAWQTTSVPPHPPMRFMRPWEEYEAAARAWLDEELDRALPTAHGVDVQSRLVHQTPSWGLIGTARADDLLVVGSRGHGGFAGLLLGSVATQCSQHARGVVVVVRAGQERLDAGTGPW